MAGARSNGWLGGAYAGYNFQVNPNWVVGLEGDIVATKQELERLGFDGARPPRLRL